MSTIERICEVVPAFRGLTEVLPGSGATIHEQFISELAREGVPAWMANNSFLQEYKNASTKQRPRIVASIAKGYRAGSGHIGDTEAFVRQLGSKMTESISASETEEFVRSITKRT